MGVLFYWNGGMLEYWNVGSLKRNTLSLPDEINFL